MGVQAIGEKKVRLAAQMTGLPLFRCLRHSNRLWYGFVRKDGGHWHVRIDPLTWEWSLGDGAFSSCADGLHGDHVAPPIGLTRLAERAAQFEYEQDRAERLRATLAFYADPATYVLREDTSFDPYVPVDDDKGALARAAVED